MEREREEGDNSPAGRSANYSLMPGPSISFPRVYVYNTTGSVEGALYAPHRQGTHSNIHCEGKRDGLG